MDKQGFFIIIYYFILNVTLILCGNDFSTQDAFIEVPKDVNVADGQDVLMPCAFHASGPSARILEIQWWFLKGTALKELPQELQISATTNSFKVSPKDATQISAVRVQGNTISHSLSLFKVRKKHEGVYECRASNLWADEAQTFKVRARLRIRPRNEMLAGGALSHIQNKRPLLKSKKAFAGVSSETSHAGLEKPWPPHQAGPGLLPTRMSSTAVLVCTSSAPPHHGKMAISLLPTTEGSGVMCNPLSFVIVLVLHTFLHFLIALKLL